MKAATHQITLMTRVHVVAQGQGTSDVNIVFFFNSHKLEM
jgi:hypothetical protein